MLLGLQNVTFEFGEGTIVEDATWHIQPNERIGLIGYNGTGKIDPAEGALPGSTRHPRAPWKRKETSIGFPAPGPAEFDTDDSILDVAPGGFGTGETTGKEIEEIGRKLEQTGDEALAHEYADKLHEMEVLDGYSIHHKTEEVLQGLGFANADPAETLQAIPVVAGACVYCWPR